MLDDNGTNVCKSCGSVHGYNVVNEYIDFYENKKRIVRKSVYHRKYHVESVIMGICTTDGIEITGDKINRIFKGF